MVQNRFERQKHTAGILTGNVMLLLDEMSLHGRRLSIDQRRDVEYLIVAAPVSDLPLWQQLSDLYDRICPVVCKDPEQQRAFQRMAGQYVDRQKIIEMPEDAHPGQPGVKPDIISGHDQANASRADKSVTQQVKKQRRVFVVLAAGLAAVLAAVAIVVVWLAGSLNTGGAPVGFPIKDLDQWHDLSRLLSVNILSSVKGIGIMVPLLVAFILILTKNSLKRYLERRWIKEAPGKKDALWIAASPEHLFSTHAAGDLLPLRRPLSLPSRRLHLPKTVEKTLCAGGYLNFCFAEKQFTSEYLICSRIPGATDHFHYISKGLAARMARHELPVHHYGFWRTGAGLVEVRDHGGDGRPDRQAVELPDLAARFPDSRLIVVDDPSLLLDYTGEPAQWAMVFSRWPEKIWITPVPAGQWAQGEQAAMDMGFIVLTMDAPDLLKSIGEAFQGTFQQLPAEACPPYPESLTRDKDAFNLATKPVPMRISRLIRELKIYLGSTGYRWLQACALFPALDPSITWHLGRGLCDDSKMPVFSLPLFARLGKLPWFQRGIMPAWLREALKADIAGDRRKTLHDQLIQILRPRGDNDFGDISLTVINQYRRALVDAIIRRLKGSAPAMQKQSALLIDFLYENRSLAFRLPRHFFKGRWQGVSLDSFFIALAAVASSVTIHLYSYQVTRYLSGSLASIFSLPWLHTQVPVVWAGVLTAGSAILVLAWWVCDVWRRKDTRPMKRQWMNAAVAGGIVFYVAMLFMALTVAGLGKVDKITPGIAMLIKMQQLFFSGSILGILSLYLRAVVAPVIPPRIAAPGLHEAFLRASWAKIMGYFTGAVILSQFVIMVPAMIHERSMPLVMASFPHPLALIIDQPSLEYFIHPAATYAGIGWIMGVFLKPVLRRKGLIFHLAAAGIITGLLCDLHVAFWHITGLEGLLAASSKIYQYGVIPAILLVCGLCVSLYRDRVAKYGPLKIFLFSSALIIAAGYLFVFGLIYIMNSGELDNDGLRVVIAIAIWFYLLFSPIAFWFSMRSAKIPVRMLGSLIIWLLGVIVIFLTSIVVLLVTMDTLSDIVSTNLSFIIYPFFAAGIFILSFIRFVSWKPAAGNPDWPGASTALPWLFVPVLWLMSVSFQVTDLVYLDLSPCFLPAAAWLGLNYRKTGFRVVGVGACPLLIGVYSGWAVLNLEPGYYILCLIVCRVFGDPGWFKRWMKKMGSRPVLQACAMLGLPVFFVYSGNWVDMGFSTSYLWLATACLPSVLSSTNRYTWIACFIGLIASVCAGSGFPWRGSLGPVNLGYGLDSLADVFSILIMVLLGRFSGRLPSYGPDQRISQRPFEGPDRRQGRYKYKKINRLDHKNIQIRQLMKIFKGFRLKEAPGLTCKMYEIQLIFIVIIVLAFHPVSVELSIPWDIQGYLAVSSLVAYFCSCLLGYVSKISSFAIIFYGALWVSFAEPIFFGQGPLFFSPVHFLELTWQISGVSSLSRFLACFLCAWFGSYIKELMNADLFQERR